MRISLQVGGSVATSSGESCATKSRASASSSCQERAARTSLCHLIELFLLATYRQGSPTGAVGSVSPFLRPVGRARGNASDYSDITSASARHTNEANQWKS